MAYTTWIYKAHGEIKARTEKEAFDKLYNLYDDFIASCVSIEEKKVKK